MNKLRKIVFIIGNGFDLDLGRPTSYKSFWESEFCPKDYPAPIIQHLNSRWPDSLEGVKWYDMENELLAYYQKYETTQAFPDIIDKHELDFLSVFDPKVNIYGCYQQYSDQIHSLETKGLLTTDPLCHTYIDIPYQEEILKDKTIRDRNAIAKIKSGLMDYLKEKSGSGINEHSIAVCTLFALYRRIEQGDILHIYDFNYTSLPYDYSSRFSKILHYIHGTFKQENIIIGTKDYEKFSEQYDFLQKSFDPNFAPPPVVYDLLDADDVIIFGHSLGINDSQYFKAFFKQQSSPENPKKKFIRIFTKNTDSEMQVKRALQQMTDCNFSMLACLNDFQIIKTNQIYQRPDTYSEFYSRYESDETQVINTIRQIKNTQ